MTAAPGRTALAGNTIVVLDVDDTLYLEESYVRSGFTAVGHSLEDSTGIQGVGDTLWSNFVSGVRDDAFDRALPAHGIEPAADLIETLVEVYRSHKPSIQLAPDAESFLHGLSDRQVAAITDGPAESQRRKAEALGLERFLNPIIFTAELGPGMAKPHHRAFEFIEERFDVPPSQCFYIGDNPAKDFAAPQERGWGTVRVRRPSSLHYAVSSPPGVAEVSSLEDLCVRYQPIAPALVQPEKYTEVQARG